MGGAGLGANVNNPVLKDTVQVPAGGYVVIRYYTDNPGACHGGFKTNSKNISIGFILFFYYL